MDQVEAALAPYAGHRAKFLAEKVAAKVVLAPAVTVESVPAGHTEVYRVHARDASPVLVAAWKAALVWHAWPGRETAPRSVVDTLDALVAAFAGGER